MGYPHELWTTRLLASHVRARRPSRGARVPRHHWRRATVCQLFDEEESKAAQGAILLENANLSCGKNGQGAVRLS